jgi:hypothetical protein
MSVVPVSQLSLSRQRKAMSEALNENSWQSMAEIDKQLAGALAQAVEDPEKDMKVLLGELGNIVKLYKGVVLACQDQANDLVADS